MKKGFTLIELMIVIAIIAIIAAIAIPGLLAAQRASNERNASASLKTITTAEADFRSNDRDGNLVNDFWTLDVYALYGLIPITGGATAIASNSTSTQNIIKLIDPSVGGADGHSTLANYGHVNVANSIVIGSTKAGYIYRMFANQDDVGSGTGTTLLNDTDGANFYGACHDRSRFACMAFPESLSSGKLLFVVNADNTIWKYNLPAGYIITYTAITASDSTSVFTGSTGSTLLDSATTFPQSPGAVGCSKMD